MKIPLIRNIYLTLLLVTHLKNMIEQTPGFRMLSSLGEILWGEGDFRDPNFDKKQNGFFFSLASGCLFFLPQNYYRKSDVKLRDVLDLLSIYVYFLSSYLFTCYSTTPKIRINKSFFLFHLKLENNEV